MPGPTYTYDPTQLANDVVYRVRNLIRDTGEDGQWALADQEIQQFVDQWGVAGDTDECRAAVALVRMNIIRLARLYDGSRSIGDLSVSKSGNVAAAKDWADALEQMCQATNRIGLVSWGDPDWADVRPLFDKGMHDNSRAGWPNYRTVANQEYTPGT
jgi:hypothetical protein